MIATAPLHVVEHNALSFRRAWRGTLTGVVNPFLFLGAMGWGLGTLVSRHTGDVSGVDYLTFLAPGLLAATAMQTGTQAGMWPILGNVRWTRRYDAMLATPIGVDAIVLGEVAWITLRLLFFSTIFFVAMVAFGTVISPWGLIAVPAAALTGAAFMAPTAALGATVRDATAFHLIYRLGITPLFLLAGTFFPISQLPSALEVVAWLTPLFHGVELARDMTLGRPQLGADLLHALVLGALLTGGLLAARVTFRRNLLQ